jgi:hypothetical protein
MSSIAAGTTTGSALVSTGDTTGELVLKTNGTTTAVTIDTSQNVTIEGSLTVDGGSANISGTSSAGANIKLYEDTDNGTNYISLKAPNTIASDVTWTLPNADGTNGQVLQTNGSGTLSWATAGGGSGDVVGPASATDNAVARFDNTTGKLIQNSTFIVNDSGEVTTGVWQGTAISVAKGGTGATTLTANNVILGNGTSAVQFVAPGTSGNVLTSNGTTWTSAAVSVPTTFDAVGTYAWGWMTAVTLTAGTTYSGSSITIAGCEGGSAAAIATNARAAWAGVRATGTLSGTWRVMSQNYAFPNNQWGLFVRVS